MTALYETHRPTSIDEFIGFSQIIQRLTAMHDTIGWAGQVFWISGLSGTGKTTLARIIADDVATELDTTELDAADVNIEMPREWEKRCTYYPQKDAYAFIVNEAHALSSRVVSRFQTMLEVPAIQKRGTFIFTTTLKGQRHLFDTKFDAFPFLSRAIMVELVPDVETFHAMSEQLMRIARSISMDGQPLEKYQDLLVDCEGNMRMALQRIASGYMLV